VLDSHVVVDGRGKSAAALQLVLTTPVQPEQHEPVDVLMRSAIDQISNALYADAGEPPEIDVYVYEAEERAKRSPLEALAWCRLEPNQYGDISCTNRIPMTFADRVSSAVAKLWLPEYGLPQTTFDATTRTLAITVRYGRAPTFVSAVDDCLQRSLRLYEELGDLTALTYVATWMGKPVLRVRFADRDEYDKADFPGLRARLGNASARPTPDARREYEQALAKLPKRSVFVAPSLP
jgi:hypothetical protein